MESFQTLRKWMRRKRIQARPYRLEVGIVILGLAVIHAVLLNDRYRRTLHWNASTAGVFGDFIGGYFGPLFSLIGVALLVMTFRHERLSSESQSFQDRYFELLKMHRDNVAEMELGGAAGKKVFVYMLQEWRYALEIVREVALERGITLTRQQALQAAYYGFFYGVGPNSSRMLKASLTRLPKAFVNALEASLSARADEECRTAQRKFTYKLFEGHQTRLGHYYRHLYQVSRYVAEGPAAINKQEFLRTVRAQLSNHEQALLLLNSLSPIGQDWWRKKLIDGYRMVQNIPRRFFDEATEIPLEGLFGDRYFEWQVRGYVKHKKFGVLPKSDRS